MPGAGRDDVALVSCVGEKRACPCVARELYVSTWFQKARALAEKTFADWYILSAEHGLLAPGTVVAPYNRTLNQMCIADRRGWAARVVGEIYSQIPAARHLVILAGERYREFIEDPLRERYQVDVPMRGMRIGEQLHWLSERLR
jgi:hypothetical protein